MKSLRITWNDNGTERTLVLTAPDGDTTVLDEVYAASGAVHVPIGPGAHGCKFERTDDYVLYPRPKSREEQQ